MSKGSCREDETPNESEVIPNVFAVASAGQRLFNFILDCLFINVLTFSYFVTLNILGYNADIENTGWLISSIVLLILYYVPQEALLGMTLGKFITRTKTVSSDYTPANPVQIVFRTICRLIPFDAISYLIGDYPVGFHDKLSNTIVVSLKPRKHSHDLTTESDEPKSSIEYYTCPDCAAGGIIPTVDGKCTNCGFQLKAE